MAGKWIFITSSIGTMRVTEQIIDALEVMGVNSLNYLYSQNNCLATIPFPWNESNVSRNSWRMDGRFGFTSSANLLIAQMDFIPFHIVYAFIKTLIFAMLLATIPSFMVTI
jgi:phospholipid/cholesterol/gamma-HCH transport system permease protein